MLKSFQVCNPDIWSTTAGFTVPRRWWWFRPDLWKCYMAIVAYYCTHIVPKEPELYNVRCTEIAKTIHTLETWRTIELDSNKQPSARKQMDNISRLQSCTAGDDFMKNRKLSYKSVLIFFQRNILQSKWAAWTKTSGCLHWNLTNERIDVCINDLPTLASHSNEKNKKLAQDSQ